MFLEKGIPTSAIGQYNSFQGMSMLIPKLGNIIRLILRDVTIQGRTRTFTRLDNIPQGKSMTGQDLQLTLIGGYDPIRSIS